VAIKFHPETTLSPEKLVGLIRSKGRDAFGPGGTLWMRIERRGRNRRKCQKRVASPGNEAINLNSQRVRILRSVAIARVSRVGDWKPARTMSPMNQNKWLIVPISCRRNPTAQTEICNRRKSSRA